MAIRLDQIPQGPIRLDQIPEKPIGFVEAFKEKPLEKIPFSPVAAGRGLGLATATKRLQVDDYSTFVSEVSKLAEAMKPIGEYTPTFGPVPKRKPLDIKAEAELARQDDIALLTKHFEEQEEIGRRGYTTMGRVGQITSVMPAFMVEFLTTGGLQKLGSAGAKRGATALLGKYATTTAGKATIATGGFAVGTAARAAGMPHRAADAILKRQIPRDIKISDEGDVKVTGPVEKPMTSLWKGLTDHYIEIASEQAGEVIGPAASKVFNRLPLVGKLTGALQKRWMGLKSGRTVSGFKKAIGTKVGFHGVLNEVGEEFLGDAARAITDIDDFGAGEDANMLERISAGVQQDVENLPAMLIAFSVPGVAGRIAERTVARREVQPVEVTPEEPAAIVEEPATAEQAIGQQYGLRSEETDTRLAQAEYRYRELKQKETVKRTIEERQELAFLRRNRTDIESLLEQDTLPKEGKPKTQQQQKPYTSQYIAGHDIPKVLGMKEKERRAFMEKETGKTSMAKMTPSLARDYIDALHALAREKGIERGVLPQERIFRKPIIGLTPQLYKAKILGIEFMTKPATIGKQKFDLEFAKEAKQAEKMERVINRLGKETIKTKAAAKLRNKPTKSVARFAELLNKHEKAPADLTKEETDVFNYFRNLSRSILAKENEIRKELNMDPIPYKLGYMRHIVDIMSQDMMEGRHPIPEELKYWAEEHAAKKIRNPMEFQRKLGDELEGIFSDDLTKATKAMLWTGLREIHLNKPLKFFETQIGLHSEVIPDSTRRWAEKFINHTVTGKQTATDQRLNDMVKESGIGKVVDKILKPFGRKISHKPMTNLMGKAGRLQIYGVMGWRPKQLIRNKFQFFQNLALYTTKANLKSFLPASKRLKELLSESLFLETYRGFEDLREIDKRTLGRLWLAPFQWTAVTNAKRAMKVAYHDTLELIESSKYRDLGWADSKRTYTEESEFLYPSEKEKLLGEMEFGAGVTQYHYIPMAMPGVFNYKAATPLTRLQSWWMNYFFKFHRESANRFFTGKTREGLKLPWSRRLGWGRYLVIGGVVLNTLGYTSSYLFGAAPEAMPPLGQLLVNLYKYIVTDDDRTRNQAEWKMLSALKTFVPGYLAYKNMKAFWETEDLTQLMFYNKGIFKEGAPTKRRTPPTRRRPK